MPIIIIICLLLTLGYLLLMLAYRRGGARQKEFVLPASYQPSTFISVIIPARNESGNIGACLASVLAQQYPRNLFEIIVVDDHSEDGTANAVKGYANVRCISLADHLDNGKKINAYKKAAITAGIAQSKGELIVTTDADCIVPDEWLLHIAAIYEKESPVMVVAPVIYSSNHTMIQVFQLIDFMSMQGITAAAHNLKLGNMSNGANLAFSKKAYKEVSGYTGIDHLASGDDFLLMMKMNKYSPGSIAYLKSTKAIVSTTPQPGWGAFLQQRIRWASKSGKYNDTKLTLILVLVYLFNLSFLVLLFAGIFTPLFFYIAVGMFIIKVLAELFFFVPVARFFGKERVIRCFFFLQPLHILYIIVAGFLGVFGSYKWKGRNVR